MNRKIHKRPLHTPVFLDKASSVSERAARAMCPNGHDTVVANKMFGNVITLQESKLHGDTPLAGESVEKKDFPKQRPKVLSLFPRDGGSDEC